MEGIFGYTPGRFPLIVAGDIAVLGGFAPGDPRVDSVFAALTDEGTIESALETLGSPELPDFGIVSIESDSVRVLVKGGIRAVGDGRSFGGTSFVTDTVLPMGLVSLETQTSPQSATLPIGVGVVLAERVEWGESAPVPAHAFQDAEEEQGIEGGPRMATEQAPFGEPVPTPILGAVIPTPPIIPWVPSPASQSSTNTASEETPATELHTPPGSPAPEPATPEPVASATESTPPESVAPESSPAPIEPPPSTSLPDSNPSVQSTATTTPDNQTTSAGESNMAFEHLFSLAAAMPEAEPAASEGLSDPPSTSQPESAFVQPEPVAVQPEPAAQPMPQTSNHALAGETQISPPTTSLEEVYAQADELFGAPIAEEAHTPQPPSSASDGFIASFDWKAPSSPSVAPSAPIPSHVPPTPVPAASVPSVSPMSVPPTQPPTNQPILHPTSQLYQTDDDLPEATVRKSQIMNDVMSGSGPIVVAAFCDQGHPNPPYAATCRMCGTAVPSQQPREIPRPPLGTLALSSGGSVLLDRGVILGRNPRLVEGSTGPEPNLVKIADPNRDISSQHVQVRLDDWFVTVIDLGSTNGTQVILPHRPPVTLRPDEPMTLEPGSRVILANAFDFLYEVS